MKGQYFTSWVCYFPSRQLQNGSFWITAVLSNMISKLTKWSTCFLDHEFYRVKLFSNNYTCSCRSLVHSFPYLSILIRIYCYIFQILSTISTKLLVIFILRGSQTNVKYLKPEYFWSVYFLQKHKICLRF